MSAADTHASFGPRNCAPGAIHGTYDALPAPLGIAQAGVRATVDFDDGSSAPIESHSLPLAAPPVEESELLLKM
jgi:hypothetical protein